MTSTAGAGGRAAPGRRSGAPAADRSGPGHRLRVPVFTAATVVLGVGAHVAAGGAAPAIGQLLLITAVVAAISSAVATRELRLPALVGAVALTEAGIHVALLGQAHAGHGVDRSGSSGMLLAHLAASLLLAWWLRRGEAAVWHMVVRAGRLVRLPSAPVRLRLPEMLRLVATAGTRRLRRLHVGPVHPVRGPPCVA